MSAHGLIGGTIRGLLVALAAATAAFGVLVILDPFAPPRAAAVTQADIPAATAAQEHIAGLRLALRDTEAQLAAAQAAPTDAAEAGSRAQYEAQIAAAIERRDLARRHAAAIRDSLEAGGTPSALAAIRDSVVIGQLLGQQAALDARLAIEGARLKAGHPTMRALTAQRDALAAQIRQEAGNIAAALEAEARIDDAQVELLRTRLPPPGTATPDTGALAARAAEQRAELDGLVDAYFNIPALAPPAAGPARNPLGTGNLVISAIAGGAALLFQLLVAARRRRLRAAALAQDLTQRLAADLASWNADSDPETIETAPRRKAA